LVCAFTLVVIILIKIDIVVPAVLKFIIIVVSIVSVTTDIPYRYGMDTNRSHFDNTRSTTAVYNYNTLDYFDLTRTAIACRR
jgi:hypothetical protein